MLAWHFLHSSHSSRNPGRACYKFWGSVNNAIVNVHFSWNKLVNLTNSNFFHQEKRRRMVKCQAGSLYMPLGWEDSVGSDEPTHFNWKGPLRWLRDQVHACACTRTTSHRASDRARFRYTHAHTALSCQADESSSSRGSHFAKKRTPHLATNLRACCICLLTNPNIHAVSACKGEHHRVYQHWKSRCAKVKYQNLWLVMPSKSNNCKMQSQWPEFAEMLRRGNPLP